MIRGTQLASLAAGGVLGAVAAVSARAPARRSLPTPSTATTHAARRAACGVNRAAALLALAALCDSAIEHYRGSFHNKTMYLPLGVATLTFAASLRDSVGADGEARSGGAVVDGVAVATGVVGTGFHLYNIAKRPGGISWLNLFYAAPLGAPAALSLAGLLRRMAATLHHEGARAELLAGLVAVGLLGTSAEAALLHFRGAYHNPAMVIPVTVPPVAAALLARAALMPQARHGMARWSLRLLVGVGLLGSAFHAYGIGRNMGGWRNWSQNVLNGPPLPAPPAFTALAVAGLAALDLIEEGRR